MSSPAQQPIRTIEQLDYIKVLLFSSHCSSDQTFNKVHQERICWIKASIFGICTISTLLIWLPLKLLHQTWDWSRLWLNWSFATFELFYEWFSTFNLDITKEKKKIIIAIIMLIWILNYALYWRRRKKRRRRRRHTLGLKKKNHSNHHVNLDLKAMHWDWRRRRKRRRRRRK